MSNEKECIVRFESEASKLNQKTLGAKLISAQNMYIDSHDAHNLVKKYFGEEIDSMRVKEERISYTINSIYELDAILVDGRMTETPDPKDPRYNVRGIDREMKRLGRKLTEEELKNYIIA